MTWEYLDKDIFQARYGVVAAYLADKLQGKIILDLNCGVNAPLLKYLPKSFNHYFGNDLRITDSIDAEKASLLKVADTEVLAYLQTKTPQLDIFCHLGWGAGVVTKEKIESMTDIISAKAIITHYQPKLVILECVRRYFDNMKAQYADTLKGLNYQVIHTVGLEIDSEKSFVENREFVFYERA